MAAASCDHSRVLSQVARRSPPVPTRPWTTVIRFGPPNVRAWSDLRGKRLSWAHTMICVSRGPAFGPCGWPNASGGENVLESASALSANDIWAVGYSVMGGVAHTLSEHWDGNSWTIAPSPNPQPDGNYLNRVDYTSARPKTPLRRAATARRCKPRALTEAAGCRRSGPMFAHELAEALLIVGLAACSP